MYQPIPGPQNIPASLGGFFRLPTELVLEIINRLDRDELKILNLTSKALRGLVVPLIWSEVNLIDRQTVHSSHVWDDHDDTPIVKKLALLAQDPYLASCVQTLTHKCHLTSPDIFNDLPGTLFTSQTLSPDIRTVELIKLASKWMKNVHTLRIILGHNNLNDALLRCFFDKTRRTDREHGYVPVRRLWLENCRISAGCNISIQQHAHLLPLELDFTGLQSIRLRRLPLKGETETGSQAYRMRRNYTRTAARQPMSIHHDPLPTTSLAADELALGEGYQLWIMERLGPQRFSALTFRPCPLLYFYRDPDAWDQAMYRAIAAQIDLPHEVEALAALSPEKRAILAYRGTWADPPAEEVRHATEEWRVPQRETLPSQSVLMGLLRSASATLTSLTLDWVMHLPDGAMAYDDSPPWSPKFNLYWKLLNCRFPHLKALQYRNAVIRETWMEERVFLMESSPLTLADIEAADARQEMSDSFYLGGLEFMEAHPKLECLAWPVDRFFSSTPTPSDVERRVDKVLERLGETLHTLRVDSQLPNRVDDERPSEETFQLTNKSTISRRRFISTFPPRLHALNTIKIEGGMPHDERREILRGLHRSPLASIVIIGTRCPLGNTWGARAAALRPHMPLEDYSVDRLEAEADDNAATFTAFAVRAPRPPGPSFVFEPHYGWDESTPPLLHTLAAFHGDSIRRLKFCGFRGAPPLLLSRPPPATSSPAHAPPPPPPPPPLIHACLTALSSFPHLESLVLSMVLPTHDPSRVDRADAVVSFWRDVRRGAACTALVPVVSVAEPHLPDGDVDDDDIEDGFEVDEAAVDGDGEVDVATGADLSRWLQTTFAPEVMAARVAKFVGGFLGRKALRREGGVHVRASFSLGRDGTMFDIDLRVAADKGGDEGGEGDGEDDEGKRDNRNYSGKVVCLEFEGPREEDDPERFWTKLNTRAWF